MKLLLDTHALLWWLFDEPRLTARVRGLLSDPDNAILVSSSSAWEISTKFRLGKLPSAAVLVQDIAGWVHRAGFRELPVTIVHAQKAGSWPQPHRDPFDRMLAAQSIIEDAPLVTSDDVFPSFGTSLVW